MCVFCVLIHLAPLCNVKNSSVSTHVCICACLLSCTYHSDGVEARRQPRYWSLPSVCSRQDLFVVCSCTQQAGWSKSSCGSFCLLIGVLELWASTTASPVQDLLLWGLNSGPHTCLRSLYPLNQLHGPHSSFYQAEFLAIGGRVGVYRAEVCVCVSRT